MHPTVDRLRWPSAALLLAASVAACGGPSSSETPPPVARESAPESPAESEAPSETPVDAPEDSSDEAPSDEASAADTTERPAPAAYPVSDWNRVAQTYATQDGGFRYEALKDHAADLETLDSFLSAVAHANPETFAPNERLAFYINAYNALTVRAVIRYWPIAGVLRVPGFFDGRPHEVAGESMTLNELETEKIREAFSEPRIHFLVNCASAGCPPLMPYAYTAENLEENLAARSQAFVRATTRIDRGNRRARVSQIFEWYAADFGGRDGVREFIANQLEGEDATFVREASTRIATFPYDWDLNARP